METTVIQSSTQTKAVWSTYRKFRSSLLAGARVESQLGMDLSWMLQLPEGYTLSLGEQEYLKQSLKALREVFTEAEMALSFLYKNMDAGIMEDQDSLFGALDRMQPGMDPILAESLKKTFDAAGGVEGWFDKLSDYVSGKVNMYKACCALASNPGVRSFGEVLEEIKALIIRHNQMLPQFPNLYEQPLRDAEAAAKEWSEKLATARAAYDRALAEGQPLFLAKGQYLNLEMELLATHPGLARNLGLTGGENPGPEPIICFILGLGWMMCIVVAVAAAASHGVDEDEEDDGTTGGDDDGGTTG